MTPTNSISFAPELPIPLKGYQHEPLRRIRGRTDSQAETVQPLVAKANLYMPNLLSSEYMNAFTSQIYGACSSPNHSEMMAFNQMIQSNNNVQSNDSSVRMLNVPQQVSALPNQVPLSNWQTKINTNCQDFGPNLMTRTLPATYPSYDPSAITPVISSYAYAAQMFANQASVRNLKKTLNPNAKEFSSKILALKNSDDDWASRSIEIPRKSITEAFSVDDPIDICSVTPLKDLNNSSSDICSNTSLDINPISNRFLDSWSTSSVSSMETPSRSKEFKEELFKTEMCRNLEDSKFCKYGANCRFAHSQEELRKVDRTQIYRIEPSLYFDKAMPMFFDNGLYHSRINHYDKFSFKTIEHEEPKKFLKELPSNQRFIHPLDCYFSPDNCKLVDDIFKSVITVFSREASNDITDRINTSWIENQN